MDGVLNTYNGEYNEKNIPPIKNGAYEFIKELSENFKIVIFTTRNSLVVSKWILENGLEEYIEYVTNIKELAYLIIDDRCINFRGDYKELKNKIKNFEFWYKNN